MIFPENRCTLFQVMLQAPAKVSAVAWMI